MTHTYYTFTPSLIPTATARSTDINAQFTLIQTALDLIDAALVLAAAQVAANPVGQGFATPIETLGNGVATTASRDYRSTTGSQAYDARIKSTGGIFGSVGKGALTVEAASMTNTGPRGYSVEYDNGSSGAAVGIDPKNGGFQKMILTAAAPAITLINAAVPCKIQLKLIQDGTGSRAPTWVNLLAINCVGGVFPALAGAASVGTTFITIYYDGAIFWVTSVAKNA